MICNFCECERQYDEDSGIPVCCFEAQREALYGTPLSCEYCGCERIYDDETGIPVCCFEAQRAALYGEADSESPNEAAEPMDNAA